MTESLQSFLALGLVVVAATWLTWRSWKRRQNPGCGGDCGCPRPTLTKRTREPAVKK